uniref:General transcription factor II-I repeat domain-containing protein 2B n=1 Tax=Sipha flava TaxID=143950 RepID=A0A2S2QYX5_9HEMI
MNLPTIQTQRRSFYSFAESMNLLKKTKELAAVHSMKDSCTGNDIFLKVKESIFTLGRNFNILKGVTTDGGRNMCGAHTGLVGNICKAVFETGAAAPMAIYCIIHQQALCGKNAPISEVMNIVVQNVNYIRKSALSHRQFKNFLAEIESEYPVFLIIAKFVGSAEVTS